LGEELVGTLEVRVAGTKKVREIYSDRVMSDPEDNGVEPPAEFRLVVLEPGI